MKDVIVGVDGTNASCAALRWAAEKVGVGVGHGNAERTAWERGEIEHFADLMRTLAGPELDLTIRTPPGLAALRLDEARER